MTLHRQQFLLQWKQTFLSTTPSSFLGCSPWSHPGAWVPQRCVGTHELGILVPASPTNWCHLPTVGRCLLSHLRKLLLKTPEARFASLILVFTMHSVGAAFEINKKRDVSICAFLTKNYNSLGGIAALSLHIKGVMRCNHFGDVPNKASNSRKPLKNRLLRYKHAEEEFRKQKETSD